MPAGYSDVLIGLQYGDEGKAKVIDLLASDYDIVARFNGGANAGHTIADARGTLALHQIPSAVFHPSLLLYIGSGCVVSLEKLAKEIAAVQAFGIDLSGRLSISSQASVIQPHHVVIDEATGKELGTTKNGIGPAYADRAYRMEGKRQLNIRLCDLLEDPKHCFDAMKRSTLDTIDRMDVSAIDPIETITRMEEALKTLTPFIERDTLFLQKRVQKGARVLFEGAQSAMLDVVKGTVPYVTSSSTLAGAAYTGGDLSPSFHRKTIGVAKAIMSRVGNGPFASEFGGEKSEAYCMEDDGNAHTRDYEQKTYDTEAFLASEDPFEMGVALRLLGGEYGTTTGRPRRMGMLDLVQLSYACSMSGVDVLFLTKCDLLSDFERTAANAIPFVTGYTLDEQDIDFVPGSSDTYRRVRCTVTLAPAFKENISSVRSWGDLPLALQQVLRTIERKTGTKMLGIGVGPRSDQFVLKK